MKSKRLTKCLLCSTAIISLLATPITQKDYSSHVADTIKNVKGSSGQIMNNAKQFLNSKDGQQAQQQAQSWFDRLVQWFQGLFN